jgi:hypothetical protein
VGDPDVVAGAIADGGPGRGHTGLADRCAVDADGRAWAGWVRDRVVVDRVELDRVVRCYVIGDGISGACS